MGTLAATLSLGVLALSHRPDGRLHLYLLDVGHGDAVLLRGSEGHQILVDGGPSPSAIMGALSRRLGFLDRGLDAVVLTDYGEDRLAGLQEVIRRYPVGLVLEPGSRPSGVEGLLWLESLRERQIAAQPLQVGQRVDLGGESYLEVLWAPEVGAEEATGTALKLVVGRTAVLLPGNLPRALQAEIAQGMTGRVEMLLIPRHGAAGALDERLLQASSPRIALVTAQAGNRYGHPAETTLRMLGATQLFRTDRHGTIEVVIDREGYEVLTQR